MSRRRLDPARLAALADGILAELPYLEKLTCAVTLVACTINEAPTPRDRQEAYDLARGLLTRFIELAAPDPEPDERTAAQVADMLEQLRRRASSG